MKPFERTLTFPLHPQLNGNALLKAMNNLDKTTGVRSVIRSNDTDENYHLIPTSIIIRFDSHVRSHVLVAARKLIRTINDIAAKYPKNNQ